MSNDNLPEWARDRLTHQREMAQPARRDFGAVFDVAKIVMIIAFILGASALAVIWNIGLCRAVWESLGG